MSKVAKTINCTNNDIKKLKEIINNNQNSIEVKNRCKAVLLAVEGKQNKEISQILGVRPNSVGDWRNAWIDGGLTGILSIARTGRPKSEGREIIEETANNEIKDNLSHLAAKAGVSKATAQRALNSAAQKYEDIDLVPVQMVTAPRLLDISGLYVSERERAVILRTAPLDSRLTGGKLLVLTPEIHSLFEENDGKGVVTTELIDALKILSAYVGEISYSGPNRSLTAFLSSLIPQMPVHESEQYYVIYYSDRQIKPVASYSSIHYTNVSGRDNWINEAHYWMDLFSTDPDYADEFQKALEGYINKLKRTSEPFLWYRNDVEITGTLASNELDMSVFNDPEIENAMLGHATIYDRSGELVNITYTQYNVVPPAESIEFNDVVSASNAIGEIDSGIGSFFRGLGGEVVKAYMESAIKKNELEQ